MIISLLNARWDLGVPKTRRSKLTATVSRHKIRAGIFYIVSIECITKFLVIGAVSANSRLELLAGIEDGALVNLGS